MLADVEAGIRPLARDDDLADFVATVCDRQYTPRYYGDTPQALAESLLQHHFQPSRGQGATVGATIWGAWSGRANVAYLVVIRKRWGTVKYSTFIVKKEHQRRGIGRALHRVVEAHYDHDAATRKLYHTMPVGEAGHLRLDLEFGYRVEAHLKDHYIQGSDELVMGRRPRRTATLHVEAPPPFPTALHRNGAAVVVEEAEELDAGRARLLADYLRATHEGVDEAFVQAALAPGPTRRLFTVGGGEGSTGFLGLARKRHGLRKALVVLDPTAPDRAAAEQLLRTAARAAAEEGARKLFAELPASAAELQRVAAAEGFRREGVLDAPYREGVDLALVSCFPGGLD